LLFPAPNGSKYHFYKIFVVLITIIKHYLVDYSTGTTLKRAKGKGRKKVDTAMPKGQVTTEGNRFRYTFTIKEDTGEQVFNIVFRFENALDVRLSLPCACYTRLDRFEEHLSSLLFTALGPNASNDVMWEDVKCLLEQFNKLHVFNEHKDMKQLMENLLFVRDRVDLAILKTHTQAEGLYVNESGWKKMFHYAYAVFDTLCKDKELCTLWTDKNKILQGLWHPSFQSMIPAQSYILRFSVEPKMPVGIMLTHNDGGVLYNNALVTTPKGNSKTESMYFLKTADGEEKTTLYLTFRALLRDLQGLHLCNLCISGNPGVMSAQATPPVLWARGLSGKWPQQLRQLPSFQLMPPPVTYPNVMQPPPPLLPLYPVPELLEQGTVGNFDLQWTNTCLNEDDPLTTIAMEDPNYYQNSAAEGMERFSEGDEDASFASFFGS